MSIDGNDWIIGRPAVIEFLRPFLDLSVDPDAAWRAVRRWKKRNPGVIENPAILNGRPCIKVEEFKKRFNYVGRKRG